jgi:hypothetical protein
MNEQIRRFYEAVQAEFPGYKVDVCLTFYSWNSGPTWHIKLETENVQTCDTCGHASAQRKVEVFGQLTFEAALESIREKVANG